MTQIEYDKLTMTVPSTLEERIKISERLKADPQEIKDFYDLRSLRIIEAKEDENKVERGLEEWEKLWD